MRRRRRKIKPLIDVGAVWEHESSEYPDFVRIPMRNGKVVRYRLDMVQLHPAFRAAMENIRVIVGYQYKGPEL